MTAESIRHLRKRLALSTHEFAEILGCSWNTVKSWECDRRGPGEELEAKLRKLNKLAKGFDKKMAGLVK